MTRAARAAAACLAATLVGALIPTAARAHGLAARADLPIPKWLFAWGAGLVLLASFAALALLWPRPKLQETHWRPLAGRLGGALVAPPVRLAAGGLGVVLLALVIWSGFDGSPVVTDNFAPTFVYVVFWVGLVPISVLFGDVFQALNPWAAIARAVAWSLERRRRGAAPPPLCYPDWLGRWPAAIGLAAFAFIELAAGTGAVPQNVAIAALFYTVITLVAMSFFGIDVWLERGEAFSVYFNLLSRISPLEVRDGKLGLRRPLSGLAQFDGSLPGTTALVAVMIGGVTFDGAAEGPVWSPISRSVVDSLGSRGIGGATAVHLAATAGLIVAILLIAALYRLGIAGARRVRGGPPGSTLAGLFAHTLVPIAVAYVGAHYSSFLLTQGQAIVPLASDPLGRGWNLFGGANRLVDYGVITATATWYLQVALVVLGHVAGLTAAHDRALVLYSDGRAALRSQFWMLGVMIGFTFLALFLLASSRA